jgi:hypothetical protein
MQCFDHGFRLLHCFEELYPAEQQNQVYAMGQ